MPDVQSVKVQKAPDEMYLVFIHPSYGFVEGCGRSWKSSHFPSLNVLAFCSGLFLTSRRHLFIVLSPFILDVLQRPLHSLISLNRNALPIARPLTPLVRPELPRHVDNTVRLLDKSL